VEVALRDRMTERTSHLAGLWIGAAISNTSHTKTKPVLSLTNEHGSQVKDQGGRQCCHNKHKKFPYRPARDVSVLSGQASTITGNFPMSTGGKIMCEISYKVLIPSVP
jgi:hypothetical protein